MIKSFLLFTSTLAVTYLAAAFIAWDLNPANWHEAGRLATAVLGLFCAVVIIIEAD